MKPNRNRPRINTTIAARTQAILTQVGKDTGLPNLGVTVDYIVTDWVGLKRAAIDAHAPTLLNIVESKPDESLHHTSLAVTEKYVQEEPA